MDECIDSPSIYGSGSTRRDRRRRDVEVVPPAAEPVTVAEAKLHCRVENSIEDAWFTDAIKTARLWCETTVDRVFITQTRKLVLDRFPPSQIVVPRPPLQSVTSIEYYDSAGVQQTLAADQYQVDTFIEPGEILPAAGTSWPSTKSGLINAVEITYVAGYGASASYVDARVKQVIKLLVAHWYANREALVGANVPADLDTACRSLLQQIWHGEMS